MDKQDYNQNSQRASKAPPADIDSDMENAEELSQADTKHLKNDDHAEKPDVDPGIDYMRWSD